MIGLPTITTSSTRSRLTSAVASSSPISSSTASRTAAVSCSSPPGFIITYDTRLMRSSPKRICGFIRPPLASTSPPNRLHRWPAIVVEPTSTATPKASSTNPGQTADDASVADRGVAVPPAIAAWTAGSTSVAKSATTLAVLFGDRGDHEVGGRQPRPERRPGRPRRSAGRTTGRRRAWAGRGRQLLAHDLTVHLARRRNVDDGVAADRGGTAEAVPAGERSAAVVVPLERRPPAELGAGRRDVPLGERADRRHDLAAPADPPAAAHAVEIDTELRAASSTVVPSATSPVKSGRREHHAVRPHSSRRRR